MFRKQTDTGQLTKFFRYTWFRYKIGLIRALIDHIYKINSKKEGFDRNIKDVNLTLIENWYHEHVIKTLKCIFLKNKINRKKTKIMKIVIISNYLTLKVVPISQIKRGKTVKKNQFYKISTLLKIAYTPTKLASFFSLKDKMPNALRSHVVYKLNCAI